MWYTLDCLAAARAGFIHADHLGSTSLTTDITGTVVAETRYLPYGEERWTNEAQPTDFTFTGQRAERGFALMDYNARYYDPGLGRFVSADTVVPEAGNPQALNRFSYAMGNPLRYTDPTGHYLFEEEPDDSFIWRQDKPANALIRTAEPMVFWEETREPTVTDLLTPVGAIYGGAAVAVLAGEVAVAAEPFVYSVHATWNTFAATYETAAAMISGAFETAAECAATGGGCNFWDYAWGVGTAGFASRASKPPSQAGGDNVLFSRTGRQKQTMRQQAELNKQAAAQLQVPGSPRQKGPPSFSPGQEKIRMPGTPGEVEDVIDQALLNPRIPTWERVLIAL
jgi:RHS repeat-associated protein